MIQEAHTVQVLAPKRTEALMIYGNVQSRLTNNSQERKGKERNYGRFRI